MGAIERVAAATGLKNVQKLLNVVPLNSSDCGPVVTPPVIVVGSLALAVLDAPPPLAVTVLITLGGALLATETVKLMGG
jgi:hypothetical protein